MTNEEKLLLNIKQLLELPTSITADPGQTASLTSIENSTELSAWDITSGNSIEFTYYTGIEAGNPSGTTTNVKTKVYKRGF